MERVRRCKAIIIATIACVVLLCAAGVSISLAAWTGGGGSNTAIADGSVGQFYVEYPRYAAKQDGDNVVQVPNLVDKEHYLQVPRRDNNKISDYYLMLEETSQYGYQEKVIRNVYLQSGDTYKMFLGTSKITIGDISGDITSNTVQNEGYYSFYLKHNDNNALYVDYTALNTGDGSGGETFDTSGYSNPITIKFKDGTSKLLFKATQTTGVFSFVDNLHMHIWSGSTTILDNALIRNAGTVDASDYNKSAVSFKLNFSGDWGTESTGKTFDEFAKGDINCISLHKNKDTPPNLDKFGSNAGGSGGTTAQITPAVPAVHGATEFTVGADGEIENYPKTEVRKARMTGKLTEEGTYLYKNYVCVSRYNSSLTDADNSIAFVEFNILNAEGTSTLTPRYTFADDGTKTQNEAWNPANDPIVKSITIKRADTDSDGNPNGGEITPAPRLYNYYPEEETHLSEIGHGDKCGTVNTTNHMVKHYNDGMYCILFFAQEKQQYFALDIEIELESGDATGFDFEQGFTLKAEANNINSWQRFEQGYGQQWGFYMGGLVNNVWLWDPRRTTQMKGTTLNGETDVQELSYDDVKVYYPKNEINLSLTVNLTAGSLVKPYMLDMTGYRRQENGKVSTAATAYLLPKKITAPENLYWIDPQDKSKGEYKRYNTDSKIDNKTNINLRIPKSAEYTFVLRGKVSTRFASGTSGDTWWVNLVTGETKIASNDPGDAWENVSHYNFMVDELIITTSDNTTEHTVEFELNGGKAADGSNAIASQTVKFGGKATKPDNPTKDNATFAGWYTDEACTTAYDFNATVSENITLYAKWAADEFTVTFDANNGWFDNDTSITTKEIVTVNQTISTLPTPMRTEYTFKGWFEAREGGTAIDPATYVFSTTTLFAQWEEINEFTVTFDSSGGSTVAQQTVIRGNKVTKPANPTKVGHEFVGWYKDSVIGDEWDFDTDTVTSTLTLVAKWSPYGDSIVFTVNGATKKIALTKSDVNYAADILTLDSKSAEANYMAPETQFEVYLNNTLMTNYKNVNNSRITYNSSTKKYTLGTGDTVKGRFLINVDTSTGKNNEVTASFIGGTAATETQEATADGWYVAGDFSNWKLYTNNKLTQSNVEGILSKQLNFVTTGDEYQYVNIVSGSAQWYQPDGSVGKGHHTVTSGQTSFYVDTFKTRSSMFRTDLNLFRVLYYQDIKITANSQEKYMHHPNIHFNNSNNSLTGGTTWKGNQMIW